MDANIEWLKNNVNNYRSNADLALAYNKEFNTNIEAKTIRYWCQKKYHIARTVNAVTEEQKNWLYSHNNYFYSVQEMTDAFNKEFGTDYKRQKIKDYITGRGIHTTRRFTKEQLDWIQENIKDNYYEDFAKMYNEKFGQNRKAQTFVDLVHEGFIKKEKNQHGVEKLKEYTKSIKAPEEWIDFLKKNRPNYTVNELTKIFNEKFCQNKTRYNITSLLYNYNIFPNRRITNSYTEEQKEWCKQNYILYKNESCFDINLFKEIFEKQFNVKITYAAFFNFIKRSCEIKMDNTLGQQIGLAQRKKIPIGHERFIQHQWWIKVANDENVSKKTTCNYRKKANVIYEKYHNVKLDDSKDYVIFLNGDINDFSEDNLYLGTLEDIKKYVPRYVSAASNNRLKNDKQLRRIALMSIQLENIINNVKEESK